MWHGKQERSTSSAIKRKVWCDWSTGLLKLNGLFIILTTKLGGLSINYLGKCIIEGFS